MFRSIEKEHRRDNVCLNWHEKADHVKKKGFSSKNKLNHQYLLLENQRVSDSCFFFIEHSFFHIILLYIQLILNSFNLSSLSLVY